MPVKSLLWYQVMITLTQRRMTRFGSMLITLRAEDEEDAWERGASIMHQLVSTPGTDYSIVVSKL